MKLPKRITCTFTHQETLDPYTAFCKSISNFILHGNRSKNALKIARKANHELSQKGTDILVCKKAYDTIMDAPIVYVEEIFETFPPELEDLLDLKFFGE